MGGTRRTTRDVVLRGTIEDSPWSTSTGLGSYSIQCVEEAEEPTLWDRLQVHLLTAVLSLETAAGITLFGFTLYWNQRHQLPSDAKVLAFIISFSVFLVLRGVLGVTGLRSEFGVRWRCLLLSRFASLLTFLGFFPVSLWITSIRHREGKLLQHQTFPTLFFCLAWFVWEVSRYSWIGRFEHSHDHDLSQRTPPRQRRRRRERPWWWSHSRDPDMQEGLLENRDDNDEHDSSGRRPWYAFWKRRSHNQDQRDSLRDDGSVDFASVQEEWASRSQADPFWWSRDDETGEEQPSYSWATPQKEDTGL